MSLLRTPLVTHGSDCESLGAGDRVTNGDETELCRLRNELRQTQEQLESVETSYREFLTTWEPFLKGLRAQRTPRR